MIIYQIYPRSFKDTDGDGIGDLFGILEKLPYIKSLGVDCIWISPFFKSPMKDFGYDVSDYKEVDPIFGNMVDFEMLVKAAKNEGIGILVDMVISHTSDQHPWFTDHPEWYLWADAKPDGSPPNNWTAVFGGPAWKWDATRRQYYYHSFLESQPDLNMHVPEVQDAVLDVMKFWLDKGVAGFRFDAVNHIFQDLKLRNNPPVKDSSAALHPYGFQVHKYDQGRPEMIPFLKRVRKLLDQYGAYSLAEVGGTDPLKLMGDYTQPGCLHSAYSFALMRPQHTAEYIRGVIQTLEDGVSRPCYAMSNHDKPRVATRWADGRDPKKVAKQMMALLLSLPGDICIYQGEELGLTQADIPFEKIQDPFGKAFWPKFEGRDGCRTPMPWDFSYVEPWLPIPPEHGDVFSQLMDDKSMFNFTCEMIKLRKEFEKDPITWLPQRMDGILSFKRGCFDFVFVLDDKDCFFSITRG